MRRSVIYIKKDSLSKKKTSAYIYIHVIESSFLMIFYLSYVKYVGLPTYILSVWSIAYNILAYLSIFNCAFVGFYACSNFHIFRIENGCSR